VTEISGAKALIEALERQKVNVIFGIIGGAILPVYDALNNSKIRHILSKHEQGAAHAADGYARASGKPGICMTTSGPGATNLVTGIANAYMDSSPVIAFTGQANTYNPDSSYMIGRDAFQEADIIGITVPITKYNYQVQRAIEIPKVVKLAFHVATTGRPGPVLIDLPKNVQADVAQMEFSSEIEIRGYKPSYEPELLQVKKAAELLAKAEKPMILAGGGVIISNASQELLEIAEFMMTPVATTLMGKGAFPEGHSLSLGHIGMHGNRAANQLLSETDVLLAVGTRFSDRSSSNLNSFCPEASIIHVDVDAAEIGKNVDVDVPIVGDAKVTLKTLYELLIKELKKGEKSAWLRRVKEVKEQFQDSILNNETKNLKPQMLLKELRRMLPEDAIVTTEVGQNQMWAALYFKALKPRTFITSGGLGTMGFGFPASLGVKVACPERIVFDIAGDGSFIMSERELACSVTENIPVTVIVLNNSVLGMVAQWQRMFYGRRYFAVKLGRVPDFVKLAEAYGAQGFHVESIVEFSKAVRDAMKSEVTTVIDVPISPEENVFPIVPPGRGLKEMVDDC
jgi:acetolactate synthase-1/2/3 large subunit